MVRHLELAAQGGVLLGGVLTGGAQGPDVGLGTAASRLQLLRLAVQVLRNLERQQVTVSAGTRHAGTVIPN